MSVPARRLLDAIQADREAPEDGRTDGRTQSWHKLNASRHPITTPSDSKKRGHHPASWQACMRVCECVRGRLGAASAAMEATSFSVSPDALLLHALHHGGASQHAVDDLLLLIRELCPRRAARHAVHPPPTLQKPNRDYQWHAK